MESDEDFISTVSSKSTNTKKYKYLLTDGSTTQQNSPKTEPNNNTLVD